MRRSADLLLRVYRNNDFLAAKAVAKSTLKPRTHPGLSFALCPEAGQERSLLDQIKRIVVAVATSREGHRSPRSGLGRERSVNAITAPNAKAC
jgi:hypothetical protein